MTHSKIFLSLTPFELDALVTCVDFSRLVCDDDRLIQLSARLKQYQKDFDRTVALGQSVELIEINIYPFVTGA